MEGETVIGGRDVFIRGGSSALCVITFYADFDEDSLPGLVSRIPYATVAAVRISDWNSELSPWEAPPVFGKEGFGCGAEDTLGYIEHALIPEIGCRGYVIGGYSLAGLFSLWACYESDAFRGCAAGSPSVWFPRWDEYVRDHGFRAGSVYLSLGDREAKTKNAVMRTVDDRIRMQYDVLSKLGPDAILEWNRGGHFDDPAGRMAKAFGWVLERVRTCYRWSALIIIRIIHGDSLEVSHVRCRCVCMRIQFL